MAVALANVWWNAGAVCAGCWGVCAGESPSGSSFVPALMHLVFPCSRAVRSRVDAFTCPVFLRAPRSLATRTNLQAGYLHS